MSPPNEPVLSLNSNSVVDNNNNNNNLFKLSNGNLTINSLPILTQVPPNITLTPFSSLCTTTSSSSAPPSLFHRVQSTSHHAAFLGFNSPNPSHNLTTSLGKFQHRNFLSIFRFKTWWSTQWVGTSGSDLQLETQWVLLNLPELNSYLLIVPIIEGPFRSALRPGQDGHVLLNAESGSTQVKQSSFKSIAYLHVSNNPYTVMKEAFAAIRVHLDTFKLLEEKETAKLIDKFGWCTWDAFYLTVDPIGVWHGVDEFYKNRLPVRFIIIDDGWQSANRDDDVADRDAKNLVLGGEQMNARLYRFDEGEKFRCYKGGSMLLIDAPLYDTMRPKMLISKAVEIEHAFKDCKGEVEIARLERELDEMINMPFKNSPNTTREEEDQHDEFGIKAFTRDLRSKFKGLDDVFVWHALCGAWGGVRPGSTHLDAKVVKCCPSSGLDGTMDDLAVVKIVQGGIGIVHPDQAGDFFESMHSYLASAGITGVKIDVIQTLEYASEEYGGRVEMAKKYYDGLSKSLKKNFKGTNLISSMQHCNDFFFLGTKQISLGRAGDDFWFQDPNGDPNGQFWLQGVHMIHCSYNSLWMGQIIHPDWDMFQSDHVCAKFHAGSRAICGGPVYVSDSLGGHNFGLLRKLVYPDGTIPKCLKYALPTRDCLFKNPLFDQKTILKIWNFNKYGGVIGAFNCQGAGWDPKERRFKGFKECYKPMEGTVHVKDIEWDQNLEALDMGFADEYAVYLSEAESLLVTGFKSDPIHIVLNPSSYELFTFVPIKKLSGTLSFAPIGLTTMLNSGGAVQDLEYKESLFGGPIARMKIKGEGCFLAYSNQKPNKCLVNGDEVEFEWSDETKVVLSVPWVQEADGVSEVLVQFSDPDDA